MAMLWGGILDLSTVDFPGKLCSVIFLAGCPFRCPYCQNYRLLRFGVEVSVEEVLKEIRRNYLIDGVCITGGEPLLQFEELLKLVKGLKDLGLAVKVDTNGYYPERLERLVEFIDYIALDFKTVPERYPEVTGKADSGEKVLRSVDVIVKSGVEYEVRTTAVPGIVGEGEIEEIAKILGERGVKLYVIQQFRNEDVLDEMFKNVEPYSKQTLISFGRIAKRYVERVVVRCDGEEEV